MLRVDCEKYHDDFTALARAAFEILNLSGDAAVEVDFVTKDEIHDLNLRTRGVDRATDVLSYPALDEIIHHLVQLAHGVFGALRQLAGGAAHLALAGVGGHDAGSTQCGPGGHAEQERGGGVCVFVFHGRNSFRIGNFGR